MIVYCLVVVIAVVVLVGVVVGRASSKTEINFQFLLTSIWKSAVGLLFILVEVGKSSYTRAIRATHNFDGNIHFYIGIKRHIHRIAWKNKQTGKQARQARQAGW